MSGRKLYGFLGLVLLLGAGCGTISSEPDTTYEDLPPQAYPFDTLWECSIEAAEGIGFHLEDSERDGSTGYFVTNVVEVDQDLVRRVKVGHRLRAKISPQGEAFRVQVSASRFEDDEGQGWSYLTKDPDLLAKYKAKLRQTIAARYQGGD